MTDAEAQRRFGDKLYIASLAVIEEKDKVRVVHDGTNGVQVNNRIRVRDQVRSPGAGELQALLRERQEVGGGRNGWHCLEMPLRHTAGSRCDEKIGVFRVAASRREKYGSTRLAHTESQVQGTTGRGLPQGRW